MPVRFATTTTEPLYWYRQSQLMMYDNRLYEMSKYLQINMGTFRAVLASHPVPLAEIRCCNVVKRTLPRKFLLFAFFDVDGVHMIARFTQSRVAGGPKYDHFTAPVLRIQRVVGRWARSRLEARRLALAMATHSRLGQTSGIRVLGLDLLVSVCYMRDFRNACVS
jgi:hypothetical protein